MLANPDNTSVSLRFVFLNLPSPPGVTIHRGYAGGFGTATRSSAEQLLPVYLVYAASAARVSRCSCRIIDAQAMDASKVLKTLQEYGPDVLVTWICLPSLSADLDLIREVKRIRPHTLVVALGAVSNVMPHALLSGDVVDLIVKGRYPHHNLVSKLISHFNSVGSDRHGFPAIPGAIYLQDGSLCESKLEPLPEDLDTFSFEVYREFDIRRYLFQIRDAEGKFIECIPLLTSIGCPHSCIYCPYPIGYGRRILTKSVTCILNEIEYLRDTFGITGFLFRDQVFLQNQERTLEICEGMIQRDLGVKWFIESRVDQVSKDFLSTMREAGCFRIHYGVETGSPELLKRTGKPGVTIERLRETFRITKEAGLAITAHMIIGLPGENRETLRESYELLRELDPDSINLNAVTPYPGTRLFQMAESNGWITTYDWAKYTSYDVVMRSAELTATDLAKARQAIKSRFRNFKLLHDPHYRQEFLRTLPKAARHRIRTGRMN